MTRMYELKQKKLLSRREGCEYLGNISLPTLDKIVNDDNFPARVTLGRRVFIDRVKLDEWLEQRTGK